MFAVLARHWAVLLFVGVATAVAVNHPYENEPVIRSDGLGYHAWTRAILDRHLSFCEYPELAAVGATTRDRNTHRCPNKYAPGLALLRFPVMGPIAALNGGELRSSSEDIASEVLSIIAGAVAVAGMVIAAMLLGVRALVANLAAVAVAFGTGLFHYATFDGSFTHVYSAAVVAVLVVFGVRRLVAASVDRPDDRRSTLRDGLVAFVLSGLLISIRLTSVLVLAVLPVAAAVVVRARGNFLRPRLVAMLVGAGAATAVAVAGQIAYNRFMRGTWTLSSYGDEPFLIDRFKQLDVLASLEQGFVTWYPVVLVVLLAALLARNWSGLALLVGLTLPLVALYGAWHDWHLGGSFGHRGFVELAPVFAVVLSVSLDRLDRGWRAAAIVACGIAIVMTLGLMAGYWSGDVSFYGVENDEWVRYTVGERSFPVVVSEWVRGQ